MKTRVMLAVSAVSILIAFALSVSCGNGSSTPNSSTFSPAVEQSTRYADLDIDGLNTITENLLGTDPFDADSDDDGLLDGEEDANHNGVVDQGETDPENPDSDGDGIPDGVELGLATPHSNSSLSQTDLAAGNFWPDADPSSITDPLNPDSDGDTIPDGQEDLNHNGARDTDETSAALADTDGGGDNDGTEIASGTNPLAPLDDSGQDSDQDGLTNAQELGLGTNPNNPDTDGDGHNDGQEVSAHTNPLDANDPPLTVWVAVAAKMQCDPNCVPLSTTIAQAQQRGITVLGSTQGTIRDLVLIMCCGCPDFNHNFLKIPYDDLVKISGFAYRVDESDILVTGGCGGGIIIWPPFGGGGGGIVFP